jgi:hypothetical protein
VFSSRCPFVIEACRQQMPALEDVAGTPTEAEDEHVVACIRKHEPVLG